MLNSTIYTCRLSAISRICTETNEGIDPPARPVTSKVTVYLFGWSGASERQVLEYAAEYEELGVVPVICLEHTKMGVSEKLTGEKCVPATSTIAAAYRRLEP